MSELKEKEIIDIMKSKPPMKGGVGQVWLSGMFAIKQGLDTSRHGRGTSYKTNQEARLLQKFKHRNICKFIDLIEIDNVSTIVMRAYESYHFSYLSMTQVLESFTALVDAFVHIHAKGVIHGDVTISNIVFEKKYGEVRPIVIDFGNAVEVGHNVSTIGTQYYYRPPERLFAANLHKVYKRYVAELSASEPEERVFLDLNNKPSLVCVARSNYDVWSLGICFFEMLTRKTLFSKYESVLYDVDAMTATERDALEKMHSVEGGFFFDFYNQLKISSSSADFELAVKSKMKPDDVALYESKPSNAIRALHDMLQLDTRERASIFDVFEILNARLHLEKPKMYELYVKQVDFCTQNPAMVVANDQFVYCRVATLKPTLRFQEVLNSNPVSKFQQIRTVRLPRDNTSNISSFHKVRCLSIIDDNTTMANIIVANLGYKSIAQIVQFLEYFFYTNDQNSIENQNVATETRYGNQINIVEDADTKRLYAVTSPMIHKQFESLASMINAFTRELIYFVANLYNFRDKEGVLCRKVFCDYTEPYCEIFIDPNESSYGFWILDATKIKDFKTDDTTHISSAKAFYDMFLKRIEESRGKKLTELVQKTRPYLTKEFEKTLNSLLK